MTNNPFEVLANMYAEQVQKQDEHGYADTYKQWTDMFFKSVNEHSKYELHFENITYLDGYCVFGFGTNSVVHFRIKECPGWLFGIWWDIAQDREYTGTGEFFMQYEETIDKFKPAASSLQTTLVMYDTTCDYSEAVELIEFIHEKPYHAFCCDYCYYDRKKAVSEEKAKKEFDHYKAYKLKEDTITAECDNKVLSWVKEHIVPVFNNAEIVDMGDGWSPRYDLMAPFKDNSDVVAEPGCYSWFEDDDNEGQSIVQEFNNLVDECYNYAKDSEVLWFSPIPCNSIIFTSEENNDDS